MKKYNQLVVLVVTFLIALLCWEIYRYIPHYEMPDLEYKIDILRKSHNITYTIEALRPLVGPEELTKFITENNENPDIYTPSLQNIRNGKYRANLHMHTTNSDGRPTVLARMQSAQTYAEKNIKDGYMTIAITDHNTVLGAKNVIEVLERYKGRFSKVRVVPGMEIFTEYKNSGVAKNPVQIHVLVWCINPYDKFLQKEFYKKNLNDKWNRTMPDRDFDWVISVMSNYGIPGVAHPARYTSQMKEKKYPYISEMFERYAKLSKNTLFTEGYYQSYKLTYTASHLGHEYKKYTDYINNEAKRAGIIRTGGTDAHGDSLFTYNKER